MRRFPPSKIGLLLVPAILGGCTATAQDAVYGDVLAGFSAVNAYSRSGSGKNAVWVQNQATAQAVADQVRAMVHRKTINADTAVEVALLNNKSLQAAYADLGLAATDVLQESQLVNPSASIGVLGIGTPELEAFRAIEGMVVNNIFALITRERRMAIAETEFRKAQLDAALSTLSLAAETRRAWIEAVSAWERVAYLNQAKATADAASELAGELGQTGALSKAGQAREHVFYAELTGQTAQARMEARQAKERLTRLMGLWGDETDYQVPNSLPQLPSNVTAKRSIEADALRYRVDLQAAALELEAMAKRYGLTDATRFVTDLDLVTGFETEREIEDGVVETSTTGQVEVEFVIPIFDTGKTRKRRAELEYIRAANLLAAKAVNVRSEARAAYDAYRSSFDIARHYRNSVLPLRAVIEEEALLTYNGMITSTFELLADTRARINSNILFIDAKRAFWLAEADLAPTIYGGADGGGPDASATPEVADAGGGGH